MLFPARFGVALLAFASPLCLIADGVVTSNSCTLTDQSVSVPPASPPEVHSQTDVNSCFVTFTNPAIGGPGRASASTTVTLHLPVSGQAATPVGASFSASASANPFASSGSIQEVGRAHASVTIDYLFTTTGAVRPGFIQLNQSSNSSVSLIPGPDRPDLLQANISVGPLSQTCLTVSPTGSCSGSLVKSAFSPTTTLPFTLGQDFLFHEGGTLDVSSFRFEIEDGAILTNFTFNLFEADGVTPVQIALATPEPDSLLLFGCGSLALLWIRRPRGIVPTP
jgi:hypothetical protein